MQEITYYCDKCGKLIDFDRYRMEIIAVETDSTKGSYDLHKKCAEAIMAELRQPEPEPPKPKRGRPKKIDEGKVRALADAGWSVEDIAGDMKITEAQVKKVLEQ